MLKFLHPHIETRINDLSFIYEEASGGGTALFAPYLSDKGEDNVIQLLETTNGFLKDKGIPNFKQHGQSAYNIINWIQSGGRVYGMRLTAPNATYSTSILNVKTRAADVPQWMKNDKGEYILDRNGERQPLLDPLTSEVVTTNGVEIKLVIEQLPNISEKSLINDILESKLKAPADDDGFFSHPLYLFTVKGRGDYGNRYSYRFTLNDDYEDTYDFRCYDFSVLETTENGNLSLADGPFTMSTFPEALSLGRTSMSINQILKNYASEVSVVASDNAYDRLIERIMEGSKDEDTDEYRIDDPNKIDFLFATSKKGSAEDYLFISPDSTPIDLLDGIKFASGSDGDFAKTTPIAQRLTAIDKAYIAAFDGVTAPEVMDKARYAFDVVLDANHSVSVKNAIVKFVNERGDVWAGLDTGILASPQAALNWRRNEFQTDDFRVSIFGQSQVIYDAFTAQDIPVTTPYFLAQKIPANDEQYGKHYPFAGPRRGIIAGFKSIDWNPNEYEKNDLYKARINYIEQDYTNTKFMTNLTSQMRTSALSSINNVRVLLEIIRRIQTLSKEYFFEFSNSSTLTSFTADINNILNDYVNNGACTRATGSVTQTSYQREMKIAQVNIDLAFTGVIERILIDINIGK